MATDEIDVADPELALYVPAVSPSDQRSGTFDEWLAAAFDVAERGHYAGVNCHCYGPPETQRAVLHRYRERWPGRLLVTESNFGAGNAYSHDQWAADLPATLEAAREVDAEALILFIARWNNPDVALPTPVDVLGSGPMERAIKALARTSPQPTPNLPIGGAPMLRGLALWVWYWDDRYLDVARRIGATTLLVKAADGATAWEQWDAAAARCREAGVEPVPWAYNYGEAREVAPLVAAAMRAGANRLIIDPEIEYEQLPEADQRAFVEAIRAAKQQHGLTVGCACFAQPQVHGAYRYDLLARVVDLWIPMVAWQVWQPRRVVHWLDHWDRFGYRPTVPWLPTYGNVTADELAASVRLALERYGAATIWAAHELSAGDVAALGPIRLAQSDEKIAAVIDALNGIAYHLARVDQALHDAQQARSDVWNEVVELKRAIGAE